VWCVPQIYGTYVAHMEDVLDLYAETPDAKWPVVCFGKSPTQMIRVVLDNLSTHSPDAFYEARGYLDVERLHAVHQAGSFFVTRAKSNFKCRRILLRPGDRSTGSICDQIVEFIVFYSAACRYDVMPYRP
jgi:hypothetical protein